MTTYGIIYVVAFMAYCISTLIYVIWLITSKEGKYVLGHILVEPVEELTPEQRERIKKLIDRLDDGTDNEKADNQKADNQKADNKKAVKKKRRNKHLRKM